ncbi:trypsin [Trichuris suis]|nr:trypsin [Trichuris suis]
MPTSAWLLLGITSLASIVLTIDAYPCGLPAVPPITASNKSRANRIVSGWQAKPHSLPWMVYLEIDVGEVAMLCAGSLVDNGMENQTDVVVTATHCVYHNGSYQPAGNIAAIVGAHNVDIEEKSFVYVGVRNYISYLYNYDNDDNDITLLRLSEPVQYTKYVSPICIATTFKPKNPPKTCFGAGWGKTKKGSSSSILKMTRINILPPSNCTYEGRKKRAICADNYYKNDLMCEGDSGSPLFCEVDGRYYLFGILSAGPADCRSVHLFRLHYIRVDSFYDWILKSIEKLKTAPDQENSTNAIVNLLLPKMVGMKNLLGQRNPTLPSNPINGMNLIAAHYGYFGKTV